MSEKKGLQTLNLFKLSQTKDILASVLPLILLMMLVFSIILGNGTPQGLIWSANVFGTMLLEF